MAERELIVVDKDEQINGLVRRLCQSGARQVVFVVPDEATVLRNPVNLRLLRFYAEQEQKRLRLVSGDAVVQRLADEAGLEWVPPEREKLSGPTAAGWRAAGGEAARRPRLAHLLAVPLLILFIGAWQLWAGPVVTVTVRPVVKEHSSEVTLHGKVGARLSEGEVPLTLLQHPVTASATVASTGRRRYGVARARGSVTFLNQETQAVRVPAGTIVTTAAGTAFRVQETVQVPGVKTEYFMKIAVGLRAGQAEARVEAVEPGSEGNVSAGRIVKLKTAIAGRLQVTNPEPLRGGEDRTVSVVTAADIGRAEREAVAALARQAQPALEEQVPQEMRLIPGSLRLSPPEVSAKAHAGDEGAEVAASAAATAFGLAYRPEVVQRAAIEAFLRTVPEGYTALERTVSPGVPQFGRVEPQLADFLVPVTGQVVSAIDVAAVRQAVRGKTPAAAEAAVRALPGVKGVTVQGARQRVPSWSGRLRVTIAPPAAGAL
ncbi:MAG: baseplate J/gp47 family protein [Bacillota bacterium]|nr:baseplate J/gp47 family protein [Bacillota bacterium]